MPQGDIDREAAPSGTFAIARVGERRIIGRRGGTMSPSTCMDAYRDQHQPCPRCHHELRAFGERLVCDACEGLMLPVADLGQAIVELTGLTPAFGFREEAPGTRLCPRCGQPMSTAKLTIELEGTKPSKPAPELDRCAAHGLWFDMSELADVLAPVAGKGFGGGLASSAGVATSGTSAARSFTFKLGGRGWAS